MTRRIVSTALAVAALTSGLLAQTAAADPTAATPQLRRTVGGNLTIPIGELRGTAKTTPISEVPAANAVPTTIYNSYIFPGGDDARRNYAPHTGAGCVRTHPASATELGAAIPQLGQAQPSQTVAAVAVDEFGDGRSLQTNVRDASTQQRYVQSCARPSSS